MTLRAKLIALVVLLAVGAAVYAAWSYHQQQLGAAKIEARDARAAIEALQKENDQLRRDAQTNEDAANALQAEKDRLASALADQPAPVIRVCEPASRPRVPAAAVVAGKPSQAPAPGGTGSSMPTGDNAGPDIGPEVQLLAVVVEQLAAQERALLKREAELSR